MVYSTTLERWHTARYREFESHRLRSRVSEWYTGEALVIIILYILFHMNTSQTSNSTVSPFMTLTPIDIGVDIVSVFIGLVAVILVVRLNQKLGGKIKSALWFFLSGVFANVFSILVAAFVGHTYVLAGATFDIHDAFMALGMAFFTLSAYRFSLLVPREG